MLSLVLVAALLLSVHGSVPKAPAGRPLEGRVLSCCTVLRYPNVEEDAHSKYKLEGLALDYLVKLEAQLGFSCSSVEQFEGTGTGFTALIERMERCSNGSLPRSSSGCQCQLGVGGWLKTAKRVGRVRFLPPFLHTELSVLTHINNTSTNSSVDFFLGAFTLKVWMHMIIVFVLFIVLRMMDLHFEAPPQEYVPLVNARWYHRARHYFLKSCLFFRLRKAALRTMFELLGGASAESEGGGTDAHGRERRGDTFRQRALTLLVVLCGLFFILLYEATMTARLVQEKPVSKYRTVEDLKKCAILVEHICVPENGAVESWWNNSIKPSGCMGNKHPNRINSHRDSDKMLAKNDKCKYLIGSGVTAAVATTGEYCDKIVKVGKPVMPHGLSMIMPIDIDNDVFLKLERATLDLLENQKLKTLEEWVSDRKKCPVHREGMITYNKTRLFFLATYVAIALMFLAMVFCQTPQGIESRGSGGDDEKKAVEKRNEYNDKMGKNKLKLPL